MYNQNNNNDNNNKTNNNSNKNMHNRKHQYLKYTHPAIFTALKLLLNSMVEFNVVLHNFGVSVITPAIKNTSHISLISKTFESLINLHLNNYLLIMSVNLGFLLEKVVIKLFLLFITLLNILGIEIAKLSCQHQILLKTLTE